MIHDITTGPIISSWKRQGLMKQKVNNVGKFSASTPSLSSNYLTYNSKNYFVDTRYKIQDTKVIFILLLFLLLLFILLLLSS